MSYLNLNQNVFLIRGALRSTIYNSKRGEVYWLSGEATEIISLLVQKKLRTSEVFGLYDKNNVTDLINFIIRENLGSLSNYHKINNHNMVEPKHFISIVWYEITNKCNLRCLHCYEDSTPFYCNSNVLSKKEEIDLLKEISSLGVPRFQFIGGEPFLSEDKLKSLIPIASKLFDKVEVFTNGTLIYSRKDLLDFIKKYNVKVAISLYSHKQAIHDHITGVIGSYKKTMAAITMLKKYKIPFRVAMVLLKHNIHEKDNSKKYLKDQYGINVRTSPVRLTGRAHNSLIDNMVFYNKAIDITRFKKPVRYNDFVFNAFYHNCYGKKIYIASDGNVYPCVMDRKIKLGNIKEYKLTDIINSNYYRTCIKMNKDHITVCKDCEFRYYCHDCRPDATYGQSLLVSKPWYCTYNPYAGMWDKQAYKTKDGGEYVDY